MTSSVRRWESRRSVCLTRAVPADPSLQRSSAGAGAASVRVAIHSVIRRATFCAVMPSWTSTSSRVPCAVELLRQADVPQRHVDVRVAQGRRQRPAEPPWRPLSSTVTTSRCSRGQRDQLRRHRHHPARVDDGDADALVGQPVRGRQPSSANAPTATSSTSASRPVAGRRSTSTDTAPLQRRRRRRRPTPSGSAARSARRATATASPSSSRSVTASRGAATRMPGTMPSIDRSHMPLWLGAVRAGDARAVQHQRDRLLVQRHVHQQLVEGAVEEGRVDRDHRVHAAHRQAGGGGHRVLLGDADVEPALGVAPRRTSRGRSSRSMAAVIATTSGRSSPMRASSSANTEVHRGALGGGQLAGDRVDRVGLVHLVDLVVLGGRVAAALLVTACTITGPPNSLARRSAASSAPRSWPSTGPKYLRPRSSNIICGLIASLMPRLAACSAA